MTWLQKLVAVKPGELRALLVSCLYFYLVLCAYYIFRPIRNEITIANGVENIQWLFMLGMAASFAIMPLFGWLTARYKTRQFMAACTLFFASNLVIFFFLFNVDERPDWVSRTFYVWVYVFNMFIVSLFWSFMNDVYSREQARRLFAVIAIGGTLGAMTGPVITAFLVSSLGLGPLLLISAALLSSSIFCIFWLLRWNNAEFDQGEADQREQRAVENKALGGKPLDGLTLILKSKYLMGICLFIILFAVSNSMIVILQAEKIAEEYTDPLARTRLFSIIDLVVSSLVLFTQLFLTSKLIRWIGYRSTLMLIPVIITLGFVSLVFAPVLPLMIALEILRRSGEYAIAKPTREMLFSVVPREAKYKAKNFIDTAILRTGDTASSWIYTGLKTIGAAGATIPALCVALGVAWCSVAYWLGSQYARRSDDAAPADPESTLKS